MPEAEVVIGEKEFVCSLSPRFHPAVIRSTSTANPPCSISNGYPDERVSKYNMP